MKKSLMGLLMAALCLVVVVALVAAPAKKVQAQTKAANGDAAKGKEVFEQCQACHNTDTDEKKMGPSLKGLYKREKLTNGKKLTDASVKDVINKGGNGMPSYADLLTDEEKTNVIAYLHTL